MLTNTTEVWNKLWSEKFSTYVSGPPRLGRYIEFMFPKSLKTLELGGGSMRDSAYLASVGYDSIGSDTSNEAVELAANAFGSTGLQLNRLDVFNTDLRDDSFDLTFHNGLLVLFQSDDEIHQILQEQRRISRQWMISVVHCGENKSLKSEFSAKSSNDPIFDIRFYSIDELDGLLKQYGRTSFYAFAAGQIDRRLFRRRNQILPYVLRRKLFQLKSEATPSSEWERIIAVTRLNK